MTAQSGVVVARYRRHVTVESADGQRQVCQLQGRRLDPVVGDEVRWYETADGGVVTAVCERTNCLERIDKRGTREAVAANLTQLLVVAAPQPRPDWQVLDRYLCAAELAGLHAVVVLNKIDLPAAADPEVRNELAEYRRIGYAALETSVQADLGLVGLLEHMQQHRSAIVGQSGVGKSSLLNALLGTSVQQVGALSERTGHGQHTTTTAMLYRLSRGAELIDSPGVRGYAPPLDRPDLLDRGFREFKPYLGHCRFANCRHCAEPDCAVKRAVEAGQVSKRRYASYLKLHALSATLPRPHDA